MLTPRSCAVMRDSPPPRAPPTPAGELDGDPQTATRPRLGGGGPRAGGRERPPERPPPPPPHPPAATRPRLGGDGRVVGGRDGPHDRQPQPHPLPTATSPEALAAAEAGQLADQLRHASRAVSVDGRQGDCPVRTRSTISARGPAAP